MTTVRPCSFFSNPNALGYWKNITLGLSKKMELSKITDFTSLILFSLISCLRKLSNFNGFGTISLFKMARLSWVEFDSAPYVFKLPLLCFKTSFDIDLYLSDLLFNKL